MNDLVTDEQLTHIQVRQATTADILVLVDMIKAMAFESEARELDPDTLKSGVQTIFEQHPHLGIYWLGVLPENGKIVADLLITTEWSDWNNTYYWWIQSVYVKPEYRGQGMITQMVRAMEEEARKAGAAELRLYAHKLNDRAIRSYEKAGFYDNKFKMMTKRLQ